MKKFLCAVTAILILSGSFAHAQSAPKSTAEPKKFDGNSWLMLSKRERANAVTAYIQEAKQRNIKIKISSTFYARKLDRFYAREALRSEPVEKVLKTAIVMEYDWAVPGKSKDEIAKSWLGEDLYTKNKAARAKQK